MQRKNKNCYFSVHVVPITEKCGAIVELYYNNSNILSSSNINNQKLQYGECASNMAQKHQNVIKCEPCKTRNCQSCVSTKRGSLSLLFTATFKMDLSLQSLEILGYAYW